MKDPYAKNYSDQAKFQVQEYAYDPANIQKVTIGDKEHDIVKEFTGYSSAWENFGAELGFVIDEEVTSSSVQDPNSMYTDDASWRNAFGVFDAVTSIGETQLTRRNAEIKTMVEDGLIPRRIYDDNTRRIGRAGNQTNWDDIIEQVRFEMPEHDMGFKTEAELLTENKEILADRRKYVEDIRERQTTGGWWAGLGGGMVGSVMDPVQSAAMILSAPAVGTMRTSRAMYAASVAWRTGALEMGIQIPTELFIHSWKEEIDSEYTWKDSLINLAASGLFAGTIGGATGLVGYRVPGATPDDPIINGSTDVLEVKEHLESLDIEAESAEHLAEQIVEVNNANKQANVAEPEQSFKERAAADGYNVERNWFHANHGGIVGGVFDNSRLPRADPDAPFNAHWFSNVADVTTGWRAQGASDTITPVYLKMDKPATMADVRRVVKNIKVPESETIPLGDTRASVTRDAMADAGFTHMVWAGREPITPTMKQKLEETGKLSFKDARGKKYNLKTGEDGSVDLYDPGMGRGESGFVTGYRDLDDFLDTMPEIESIAVFDPRNIRVDVDHVDFKEMPVEEFLSNVDNAETRIDEAVYDPADEYLTPKEMADEATALREARELSEPETKSHTSQASFRKDAKERGFTVRKHSDFEPDVVEDSLIALPNKNSAYSESVGEYDISLKRGEIRAIQYETPKDWGDSLEFETRAGVMKYAQENELIIVNEGDGHLSIKDKAGKTVGDWDESVGTGNIDKAGTPIEEPQVEPQVEVEEPAIPVEVQGRKTVQNGKIVDEEAEYQALLDEDKRRIDIKTCIEGKTA